ncbi:MAG TPA: DUF4406 domain-containing protein [Williamwhitmania sp.]|nr:DUF4406 domain-containing protein [Williamwhitmania sp.]
MTVYIAGPMTGIEQGNLPAFLKAKAFFEGKGFDVIIPHYIAKEKPFLDYGALLAHDIFTIGTRCHIVAMLEGYRDSKGAMAEYVFCRAANKLILHAENGAPIQPEYMVSGKIESGDDDSMDSIVEQCQIRRHGIYPTIREKLSVEGDCAAGDYTPQQ